MIHIEIIADDSSTSQNSSNDTTTSQLSETFEYDPKEIYDKMIGILWKKCDKIKGNLEGKIIEICWYDDKERWVLHKEKSKYHIYVWKNKILVEYNPHTDTERINRTLEIDLENKNYWVKIYKRNKGNNNQISNKTKNKKFSIKKKTSEEENVNDNEKQNETKYEYKNLDKALLDDFYNVLQCAMKSDFTVLEHKIINYYNNLK